MMLAGPIVPTILALAAPNVLNVAMQSLVSISDGWFVGQLGIVDLAALALVFPTQMTLGHDVGRRHGRRHLLLGGARPGLGQSRGGRGGGGACAGHRARHGGPVRRRLRGLRPARSTARWAAAARALDGAEAFATVLFLGCAAHWVANSMASVLRGTGDMKTPGYALVATAALQIPLTGALTLGWFGLPALGIRGPGAGGGDLLHPRRGLDAVAADRPEGGAAAALAGRRFPLGRRSATS